jgi:hypothetical protein
MQGTMTRSIFLLDWHVNSSLQWQLHISFPSLPFPFLSLSLTISLNTQIVVAILRETELSPTFPNGVQKQDMVPKGVVLLHPFGRLPDVSPNPSISPNAIEVN